MATVQIRVPLVPKLIKEISQLLITSGLTRKTTVKGDTIEAVGEAGIGFFRITQEEAEADQVCLQIEARNSQSLEIIINLVKTGIEDHCSELEKQGIPLLERTQGQKEEAKVQDIKEGGAQCLACQGIMELAGTQVLLEDLKVKVLICNQCNKVELYRE